MDERGQFTFYRSFWEAVKGLPKKDKLPILEAIISYALDGIEPSGLSQSQFAFFLLVKPTLDSSRKKAANGKQGGKTSKANDKQTGSKPEANDKQPASEKERENEKENENENEKENECYIGAELPPVISLPLNDSTAFSVTQEMLSEFVSLYPAVDVMQELRNMRGWLLNNPKNRKTRSGVRRFINSWLSREQDKGGTRKPVQPTYNHGADRLAAMIGRGDFDD